MSLTNEGTVMTMPVTPAANGGTTGWGGDWGSWIILFLIFGIFGGWGGRGFGGNSGSAMDGYVLTSDFAQVDNRLDNISNGLCNGFYTQAQLVNGVNMNIAQNGYESRLATQTLGSQLSSCCCDIREGIAGVNYNMAMNAKDYQAQLANCCCENEKAIMGINYNMATQNAATLQAIDKVGDRIIDYLCAEKTQALRDENQALRLAASQQAQNAYLVHQLRPFPTPAFTVPNPFAYAAPAATA